MSPTGETRLFPMITLNGNDAAHSGLPERQTAPDPSQMSALEKTGRSFSGPGKAILAHSRHLAVDPINPFDCYVGRDDGRV